MSDSLIPSFFYEWCERIAQVAHQIWAMWANCSGCSPKMSGHERFAQFAHQKGATMSKSLRLLTKSEGMSESLICWFFRRKRAIRSENRWANSKPWKNPYFYTDFGSVNVHSWQKAHRKATAKKEIVFYVVWNNLSMHFVTEVRSQL